MGARSVPLEHPAVVRLSEVVSALSRALDIVEGQPEGHAIQTCRLGMRVAEEIGLPADQRSALFYALLLKDLGCSSNAAKVSYLFGADDHTVKRDLKVTDWSSVLRSLGYLRRNVAPDGSALERMLRLLAIALQGQRGARRLVEIRCERGAQIARMLGFPEETAQAIRTLDEHWDGRGHPDGLRGDAIPLLGRIVGLAQTVEVFVSAYGPETALGVILKRRGRWFDPDLVKAFRSIGKDADFWQAWGEGDLRTRIAALEPADYALIADEWRLDRIAEAFAQVIDAKSPWTYRHSEGVAQTALGIGNLLGCSRKDLRTLWRAALLHDIGKLGVSNRILDKPGTLTEEEWATIRRHPAHSERILTGVGRFRHLAFLTGAHHERLDGRGYPRGLTAPDLPMQARVLVVADVCQALSEERPYRPRWPRERALEMMRRDLGAGLCPESFQALEAFIGAGDRTPVGVAA